MQHGSKQFDIVAPRSRFHGGSFGRLFRDLDAWAPEGVPDHELEAHFLAFTSAHMAEQANGTPDQLAAADTADRSAPGRAGTPGNGNSELPSGYVYFGQFVDHDITLDVTPLTDAEVDPERLHNFRTPRLDLDSLYGLGPEAQPYLYEHSENVFTGRFIVAPLVDPGFNNIPTSFRDLQRNSEGRALIGDPRNDENAIVAQMHTAFLLAHNTLVERARNRAPQAPAAVLFGQARATLKRLYQWIVWHDFVRRIADPAVHAVALVLQPQPDGRQVWKASYENLFDWRNDPFMPVEFSAAAYRFGHTLVRNAYQTNIAKPPAGFGTFHPIFSTVPGGGIAGGRALDLRRVVEWDWFLQMQSSVAGVFPQRARAFDTKLSRALQHMPEDPVSPGNPQVALNVLATRNLVRGVRLKLPSGPDVARRLGLVPIQLGDNDLPALWYYILKEAEIGGGDRLGTLGSILVCAVFAGLLKGDPQSWLNLDPLWTPNADPLLEAQDNQDSGGAGNTDWGLPAIIRLSGLPVAAGDFGAIVPVP